jgi:hypothetical protein
VILSAVNSDNRFGRIAATKSSARRIDQRSRFAGTRSRTNSSRYRSQPEGRPDSQRDLGLPAGILHMIGRMVDARMAVYRYCATL